MSARTTGSLVREADLPNRISIRHQGPARGPDYEQWRDGICSSFCRLDVGPSGDGVIDCHTQIAMLHSVAIATPKGTSARFARTRYLLGDGCDDLVLISALRGAVRVTQEAKTIDLVAGQMCLTEMNVVGAADLTETGTFTTTRFPRAFLLQISPAAETQLARPLGQDGALRDMFDRYFALCNDVAASLDADGQKVAARHLIDLVGLLSGAGAAQQDVIRGRGLTAARLDLLKSHIVKNLGQTDVGIEAVAKANGLSERQVQRLFAHAGTTFSEYLLEQRLDLARRSLLSERQRKISDIAYSAGFSDLSYFNRAFRRRFSLTPSDLKAREGNPHEAEIRPPSGTIR